MCVSTNLRILVKSNLHPLAHRGRPSLHLTAWSSITCFPTFFLINCWLVNWGFYMLNMLMTRLSRRAPWAGLHPPLSTSAFPFLFFSSSICILLFLSASLFCLAARPTSNRCPSQLSELASAQNWEILWVREVMLKQRRGSHSAWFFSLEANTIWRTRLERKSAAGWCHIVNAGQPGQSERQWLHTNLR